MFMIPANLPGSGGSCTIQWSGCQGTDCCPVFPTAAVNSSSSSSALTLSSGGYGSVFGVGRGIGSDAHLARMAVDLAVHLVAVVLMVAAALTMPPGVVVESVVEESAQAAMEEAMSISLHPPGTTPNKELARSPATPEYLSSSATPHKPASPSSIPSFQEGSFLGLRGWKPWLFH